MDSSTLLGIVFLVLGALVLLSELHTLTIYLLAVAAGMPAASDKQQVINVSESDREQRINFTEGEKNPRYCALRAKPEPCSPWPRPPPKPSPLSAASLQHEGGMETMKVRVAEDFIECWGGIAKEPNVMIVSSDMHP